MEFQKIYLISGVAAFLVFLVGFFFVFPLMYPGYELAKDSVSDLGALNSPIKTLVNVFGFGLWGLLVMTFGYGVYNSKVLSNYEKIGGLLLILAGLCVYLVGIFPYDGGTGTAPVRNELHRVESLTFLPMTLAFFIFAVGFFRKEKLRWLSPLIILLGFGSWIMKGYLEASEYIAYSGLIQRATVGLPFLAIALISIGLYKFEFKKLK